VWHWLVGSRSWFPCRSTPTLRAQRGFQPKQGLRKTKGSPYRRQLPNPAAPGVHIPSSLTWTSHRPPHCPAYTPDSFLTQGLCTGCTLCLHPPSRSLCSLHTFRSQLTSLLPRDSLYSSPTFLLLHIWTHGLGPLPTNSTSPSGLSSDALSWRKPQAWAGPLPHPLYSWSLSLCGKNGQVGLQSCPS
jgi:hypothetical protein